ncbi:GAP family protein [Streptomyces sp. NPDC017936]|uniref:GAP family protein n=1 Tax=Streptomyces sp. NPDC017936 TaxID=3365016 RepID=UPI0037922232
MGSPMVLDLLLIALAITLDPLPLMAFVLVVASARGVLKGLTFILGWLTCFVVVIALVLALTGGQPPPPRSPPSTAALVVKLVIGVSLVVYGAVRGRRLVRDRTASRHAGVADRRPSRPEPSTAAGAPRPGSSTSPGARPDRGSVVATAGLAVLLQPWGLVAAGALTVMQADTSRASTWLVLVTFCVVATASLLAAELYAVCAPAAAQRRLLGIRTWMEDHAQRAIAVGSLAVGLWLAGKSVWQLTG